MDFSATVRTHLTYFVEQIGPRYIGSCGNHAAAGYLMAFFRDLGFSPEEQRYDCPAWISRKTILELDGQQLSGEANTFSPECDLRAPIVPLCTASELRNADLAGKVPLLYGQLMATPLAAKSWFLKTDRDVEIIRLLEEKNPPAILTMQPDTSYLSRGIEDWEFLIPSATLYPDAVLNVLRHPNPIIRIVLDTSTAPGNTANIVARKAGKSDNRIVVCAHYDTVLSSPGAVDNGGGVSVLLALAEYFRKQEMEKTIEFVAFTGEEYLPIGDDAYWRKTDPATISAVINMDGVGALLGTTSMTSIACTSEFESSMKNIAARYPAVAWVPPWPESNHSTFTMRGIPAVALGSVSRSGYLHYPHDSMDGVSFRKLSEAASLCIEAINLLQTSSPDWGRLS